MTSATKSITQWWPLNCVFGKFCIRICIAFGYQLSRCLLPILLYHTTQFPTILFLWWLMEIQSHGFYCWFHHRPSLFCDFYHYQSIIFTTFVTCLWAIKSCPQRNPLWSTVFPFTLKSNHKNDFLPSLATLNYHFYLFTCPPCLADKFTKK